MGAAQTQAIETALDRLGLGLGEDADARIVRSVPVEAPIAIEVSGIGYAVMMATPADLEDRPASVWARRAAGRFSCSSVAEAELRLDAVGARERQRVAAALHAPGSRPAPFPESH